MIFFVIHLSFLLPTFVSNFCKLFPSFNFHIYDKNKNIFLSQSSVTITLVIVTYFYISGTPCDNYRGYCDVFHRCRGVDNDGPLERLKNLIFGEETLSSIKDWIIVSTFFLTKICIFFCLSLV